MMLFYELWRQRIKLRRSGTTRAIVASVKLADIQKNYYKEIKSVKGLFFDWKTAVAICSITAFDLDTNLCPLIFLWLVPRIWMDTDEIVAFIPFWGFVCKYISPHQMPHHQIFGT